MRPVSFEIGVLRYPAGSCRVNFGNTQVLCTVCIEEEVPAFLKGGTTGWLTAEYAMLPGSTPNGRRKRELLTRDGRSTEIQRLIGRSLRAAVDLSRLPGFTIFIDCDVTQADGGTRTAAISGAWVALYQALDKLAQLQGRAGPREYLYGQVAAVSVGVVNGAVVCDLDYQRDSSAEVDMNVVMRDRLLVEVQGTGEHGVFDRAQLGRLLDAAEEGIAVIQEAQRRALGIA